MTASVPLQKKSLYLLIRRHHGEKWKVLEQTEEFRFMELRWLKNFLLCAKSNTLAAAPHKRRFYLLVKINETKNEATPLPPA